MRCEEIEMC